MIFVGIDPGLDGAIAALTTGGENVASGAYDTPTAVIEAGRRRRRVYLPSEMARLLSAVTVAGPEVFVVLEEQQAYPGQGVNSTFQTGRGIGLWEGIVAALGLPYQKVQPARWKRVMMDGMGKEKDAARVRALQLFPTLSGQLARKMDHGRAEALLLAEYGRRIKQGGVSE